MNNLPVPGNHVHLIAICGVGMAALAGLLQSLGYRVTGSDAAAYPPMSTYLDRLGIPVQLGYHTEHLEQRPDLVVVGNAVSRDNPEVQVVLDKGVPSISFPQALRMFLIGSKKAIVVAGTHGKTSTTSLLAWVLSQAKLDPSFFVGGLPVNFDSGFQVGGGPWAVLEGDEYDSAFFDKGPKFLHYKPEKVILTSLEFDHADIYTDLEHMKGAFRRLVEIVPSSGTLLVSNQYEAVKEVVRGAPCPVIYYGEGEPTGWVAKDIRVERGQVRFEPIYKGTSDGTVAISLFGRHNVDNALGVFAMARELGLKPNIIRKATTTSARWVKTDGVAFFDIDHPVSHINNRTGTIRPQNMGKRNLHSCHSLAVKDVDTVERCSPELDHHLARGVQLWIIRLLVTKLVQPSVLMDTDSFQKILLLTPWSINPDQDCTLPRRLYSTGWSITHD